MIIFLKKIYRKILAVKRKLDEKIERIRLKKFYRQFHGKNNLFFDIGANVGDRSEIFLNFGSKVVAVEPQETCVKEMKEKFKSNPNIIILKNGVGSKKEKKQINISGKSVLSTFSEDWVKFSRFNKCSFKKGEIIDMVTLDEMINKYGIPDFCKIDVEGFEYEVISGLNKKIPCLSFEFAGEFFEKIKMCLDKLDKLGFTKYNFSLANSFEFHRDEWYTKNDLIKIMQALNKDIPDFWGDVYAK